MTDIYKWLFGARGKAGVTMPVEPLPEALLPHRRDIDATIRPMIAGTVLDGPPTTPTGSQLGGLPWWPEGLAYPKSRDGTPLFLLVQINFAETQPLDMFPTSGLLQVFIAAGELYGIDFDRPFEPGGHRIVLHTDLAKRPTTRGIPTSIDGRQHPYLPLQEPFRARAISLSRDAMPIDMSDHRFEAMLPDIATDEDLAEHYAEWHMAPAIRLGGYPNFTQDDPRRGDERDLGDVNLLTIDTTDGIMWGDSGVGQFLMREADLKRRDFSRVCYNWDCC